MLRRHTCGDTGQLSRGRAVSWRTQRMRVGSVACDCGSSRAWRRVSQRADPEPPAGSSRFGRALLLRRARFDDAVGRLGLFAALLGPAFTTACLLRAAARTSAELFRSKKIDKRGRTR